jgi:hypothetical protein
MSSGYQSKEFEESGLPDDIDYDNEAVLFNQPEQFRNERQGLFSTMRMVTAVGVLGAVATLAVVSYGGNTSSSSKSVVAWDTPDYIYSAKSDAGMQELFSDFKTKFNVNYETEDEETLRYQYFQDSLLLIDKLNTEEKARGGSAKFGITKFSDRSLSERKNLHKSTPPSDDQRSKTTVADVTARSESTSSVVSWVDVYTTPVKDQGYCGSCWAFSSAEQIESDSIRLGLLTTDDWLSPQQLVSW